MTDWILRMRIVTNCAVGAAVRFAFTLCEGQGADIVAKALFTDGIPNSLGEYLATIDKDYKKWRDY